MRSLLDSEIRIRAYLKWEAAACPNLVLNEDRNVFWFEAQRELLDEMAQAEGNGAKKTFEGEEPIDSTERSVKATP